jgi:hypothetical protein
VADCGVGSSGDTATEGRGYRPVAALRCRGVSIVAVNLDKWSGDHVETAMVRPSLSFLFAFIVSVCAAFGSLDAQVTVVQRTGPQTTAYSIFANQALGVTWSQTSPFTGVSVFATIGGVPGSGFAYLTNRIGPGTTAAANQIASTPIVFPAASTETQLFSGLSLPPDTYYLTLAGSAGSWGSTSTPTVNKAAGVTLFADYATFTPAAYPPSSSFFSTGTNLIFRVTAAVPESSAAVQFLFGGWSLALLGFGGSIVRPTTRNKATKIARVN